MSTKVFRSAISTRFDLLTSSAWNAQKLMQDEEDGLSAYSLAEMVMDQINRHNKIGKGLRAIIDVAPREQVLAEAERLDRERKNGVIHSRLHGIPVIVKDTIATDPSLNMRTTAGSCALRNSKPAKNAAVVDSLIKAGMIIVGKSSLTEFNNYKGDGLMGGWSPVGGQTLSAYVRGRIAPGDIPIGHSTPGGSSTGSAVGVSAGFALVSLGLETDGSIVTPASRASLYAMKPTIHSVSLDGVLPVTKSLDSVGGMAREPEDLATLTEIIQKTMAPDAERGYLAALDATWSDIRLGFLDETIWQLPAFLCEPIEEALKQMRSEYREAMDKIKKGGAFVQYPVALPTGDDIWPYTGDIMKYEFKLAIDDYLAGLSSSDVRSLEELVEWNLKHKDEELPQEYPSQSSLEYSLKNTITADENARNIRAVRELAGKNGVDKVLREFDLDAIATLSDSPLPAVASASGYPVATMPLGLLDLNGRPFGMSVIAGKDQEYKLFQVMGAWRKIFDRKVPLDL